MAATSQGSSDMADQVKLGRMFKAGALLPIVEAIVTYQQVRGGIVQACHQAIVRCCTSCCTLCQRKPPGLSRECPEYAV